MPESSKPAVSIILPTYNRAKFLPDAFAAIRGQLWSDWELIVIDDGSTDNTRELVAELSRDMQQPVRYSHQDNQGAYGARNAGLDQVRGKYIAFYDSDDVWLPHHLSECVESLEANPDVDWVYGACRMVNLTTGREVAPTTFYVDGKPRPFLSLKARTNGKLSIIEDVDAARCQILHGLYCGLQNSVIRSRVLECYRFDASLRNEAEDQVVVIWALVNKFKIAYLNQVHVIYNIHEANSSSASLSTSVEKQQRLHEALIAGFERLKTVAPLSARERLALAKRIGREHFWILGYATHWMHGNKRAALRSFRRGIACWPWDWRLWKTCLAAHVKTALSVR
jgi:glycosyltransferase domain-containing protein